MANCVDTDKTALEQSDQDFHCFLLLFLRFQALSYLELFLNNYILLNLKSLIMLIKMDEM